MSRVAGSWRKNTDWSGAAYAGHERAYARILPNLSPQEEREERLDLAHLRDLAARIFHRSRQEG